jgi:hypothetical protein
MKTDAKAQVPGKPLPRLDMRAKDARPFRIDCSALLREFELLVCMESADSSKPHLVAIESSRTRAGTAIEAHLRVSDDAAPVKFEDATLTLVAKTTQGFLRVTVLARVHE